MSNLKAQAILVLPRLNVQNANAISSPLTHGFPSITAFMGFMWALQRKLQAAGIPLQLLSVGVVCHHHQEQITQGDVSIFNLKRQSFFTPKHLDELNAKGAPPAFVEEGRIHLQVSLVFAVAEQLAPGGISTLVQGGESQMQEWAKQVGDIASQMRVAGGTLLPSRSGIGKKALPWIAVLAEDPSARQKDFRKWYRQWLPGFSLVGCDDLLADRLAALQVTEPDTTLLDAWLHVSRFNHEAVKEADGEFAADGKVQWADPWRKKGSGWTVPIPVGYAALSPRHEAGTVASARDMATPLRFVESVYSMGQWISPHRLNDVSQLLWLAETDEAKGLYRCRNAYQPQPAVAQAEGQEDEDWDEEDDDYVDD